MQLLDFYDMIAAAVCSLERPAVYVANHEVDSNIMMEFVREVNKRYGPHMCTRLINETFDEGLVLFDTADEAVEFYSIFENEVLSNSGLMAIMYDSFGNRVCTSIAGVTYE